MLLKFDNMEQKIELSLVGLIVALVNDLFSSCDHIIMNKSQVN